MKQLSILWTIKRFTVISRSSTKFPLLVLSHPSKKKKKLFCIQTELAFLQHPTIKFRSRRKHFRRWRKRRWCNFSVFCGWDGRKYVSHIIHNIYNFIIHHQPPPQKQWKKVQQATAVSVSPSLSLPRPHHIRPSDERGQKKCWKFILYENCY
jgi:hypothetical protein